MKELYSVLRNKSSYIDFNEELTDELNMELKPELQRELITELHRGLRWELYRELTIILKYENDKIE
jgi:hypothetical protein